MRTLTIAMGLLVAALAMGLGFAAPRVAQGQEVACENAEYRTGASALLPGCRVYELVSPAGDPSGTPAGVATDGIPMPGRSSDDGNDVVYGAPSAVGSAVSGAPNPLIFGHRTDEGWTAETAIRSGDGGNTPLDFSQGEPVNSWIGPDARSVVFTTGKTLGGPNTSDVGISINRIDAGLDSVPEWISAAAPSSPDTPVIRESYTSRDLSTVVFQAITAQGEPSDIYAWRSGDSEVVATGYVANWTGSSSASPMAMTARNPLSADGRYLLFHGDNEPNNAPRSLYVRDLEEGITRDLVPISTPALRLGERGWHPSSTTSGPLLGAQTVPAGFAFAASDAPVAYFRSAYELAEGGDGERANKVYRANLETGEITYLPGLTGPPVGVSPDGSGVMFIHPTGPGNSDPWELRYWSDESPETATVLGTVPGTNDNTGMVRTFRSTFDGSTWLFNASGSLDPERANLKPTAHQAYRWEVGEEHPTCLSCESTDNTARFFGVNFGSTDSYSTETIRTPNGLGVTSNNRKYQGAQPARAISADGSIIAFDSPDRLVSADTNNVRDAYIWDESEPEGKRLRLLSSGKGKNPSYYLDMSPDASNVFFATQDELVEADVDKTYDVYVARDGGGIAAQQEEGCSGDSCQGPTPRGPDDLPSGSDTYNGKGNPEQPRGEALLLLNKSIGPKAAKFRVRVSGAGQITATGKSIKRARLGASAAGVYTLRAGLKKKAAKKLNERKRLRTPIRISFKGEDGSTARKRANVLFKKKPKRTNGKRGGR